MENITMLGSAPVYRACFVGAVGVRHASILFAISRRTAPCPIEGEVLSTDYNGHTRLFKGVDHTQAVVVVTHWKDNEVLLFDL
jgi:hypothetical protein